VTEVKNVPFGVENTMFLEDLGDNGDCRVDGVGDDKDECFGSRRGDANGQVMNNASVDLPTVSLVICVILTAPTLKRSSL
jgi:hypothetical protein